MFQVNSLPSESSAGPQQRIHMKNQALFSSKDKSKKLKCHLLEFLFGALRVKAQKKKKGGRQQNLHLQNFKTVLSKLFHIEI